MAPGFAQITLVEKANFEARKKVYCLKKNIQDFLQNLWSVEKEYIDHDVSHILGKSPADKKMRKQRKTNLSSEKNKIWWSVVEAAEADLSLYPKAWLWWVPDGTCIFFDMIILLTNKEKGKTFETVPNAWRNRN